MTLAYCRALAERIDREPSDAPGVQEAQEWLSWAPEYASLLDPLRTLPTDANTPSCGQKISA
jgi:hypothetical protein